MPLAFSSHRGRLEILPNLPQISGPCGTAFPLLPPPSANGQGRCPVGAFPCPLGPPSAGPHRLRLLEPRGIMGGGAQSLPPGKEKVKGAARAQRPPGGVCGEQYAQDPWSPRSGFHSLVSCDFGKPRAVLGLARSFAVYKMKMWGFLFTRC